MKKLGSVIVGLLMIITGLFAWYSTEQQRVIRAEVTELNKVVDSLTLTLREFNDNIKTIRATITYYHPNSKGINADVDPGNTAFMRTPMPGRTIAISRELYKMGWGGHKIYIPGFGVGVAEDLMGKSVKGIHIDICVPSKAFAMKKGKRTAVITRLM